jgi:hypothetical protein
MDQVIIYPNEGGGIVFCYPANCGLTIEEIAQKDVPAGVPYQIVPASSIPQDPLFFDAYEADFSKPDGYGIGAEAWFAKQEKKS